MATLRLPSFRELCESIGLRGDERNERDTVPLLSKISTKPSLEARPTRHDRDTREKPVFDIRIRRKYRKNKDREPKPHKCDKCNKAFKRRMDKDRHLKVTLMFL
jgi:uncharacterized Zn-finger protein